MRFAMEMQRLLTGEMNHTRLCQVCHCQRPTSWFRRDVKACNHCLDLSRRRNRLSYQNRKGLVPIREKVT